MSVRIALSIVIMPLVLWGTQIQWYCPPGLYNADSDGQAMDASFTFEMGTFANGFVPSTENMADWAANWQPVQRVQYNETHDWFTSVYTVTGEEGVSPGTRGYIWGFKGSPVTGEWLLCSGSSWIWPSANSRNPVAKTWNAHQADIVVMGSINDGVMNLQSAVVSNVPPPKTTWKQWAARFLGNPNADPQGDANGNGITDIAEFVSGLDGGTAPDPQRLGIRIFEEGQEKVLELLIPARVDRPARINMEISSDLETWYNANTMVNLHANLPLQAILRDQSGILNEEGPWFWRYSLAPEE